MIRSLPNFVTLWNQLPWKSLSWFLILALNLWNWGPQDPVLVILITGVLFGLGWAWRKGIQALGLRIGVARADAIHKAVLLALAAFLVLFLGLRLIGFGGVYVAAGVGAVGAVIGAAVGFRQAARAVPVPPVSPPRPSRWRSVVLLLGVVVLACGAAALWVVLVGQNARAVGLAPDGVTLYATTGSRLVAWDLRQPPGSPALASAPFQTLDQLAVSSDGHTLASDCGYNRFCVWVASNFATPVFQQQVSDVAGLAFSPDGGTLAVGIGDSIRADNRLQFWTVANLTVPLIDLDTQRRGITAVAFGPDGHRVAAAAVDGGVSLWDDWRTPVPPYVLVGPWGPLHGLAFSPDGTLLATGCDNAICLWDLTHLEEPPVRLTGLGRWVETVAFSPQGRTLAAGAEHQIWIWNLAESSVGKVLGDPLGLGRWFWPLAEGHTGSVKSLAFNRDGTRLVSGGLDGTILLWDVQAPLAPPQRLHIP